MEDVERGGGELAGLLPEAGSGVVGGDSRFSPVVREDDLERRRDRMRWCSGSVLSFKIKL